MHEIVFILIVSTVWALFIYYMSRPHGLTWKGHMDNKVSQKEHKNKSNTPLNNE